LSLYYARFIKLKLEKLVWLALERNPELRAYEDLARAGKFRASAEGALPDPVIGFSLKNVGLDRFSVGEEMMSGIGLSFSQVLPFPGKLRLKEEMARQKAYQAEESFKQAKLSLVRKVKDLYAKLFFSHRSLELLEKKKSILENALRAAEAKYSVGKGIQSDIFKAQVEISSVQEMILSMEGMAAGARASLNGLLDFPPENPLGFPEEIPFRELALDREQLIEKSFRNSPLIKSAELMVEESDVGVRMAKKEFLPNFMISVGREFKGVLPDMYEVMVGVEVPLFYKKKQAKLLEESLAERQSSQNELASRKNEIRAMLAESYAMAKTSEGVVKLFTEKIIPQASLALESSLANYQADRADFLMLLSDINSLIAYEMDYYKNLTDFWSSAARIEELTAREIIK
jgi:outer membrane protein TolC